jgi:two-component system sensor histidine kinase/response regulator
MGPWSPAALVERLGGDEALARQLAAIFVAECPRMMAAVRDAVSAGDALAIRRAAHALKGSVGNFTSQAPMTTALALEEAGRRGDLGAAATLVSSLEREVAALVEYLERFSGEPCTS